MSSAERRPVREVALVTNPSAGRGRAARAAAVALPALREAGLRVQSLTGHDADDALRLARAALDGGVDALVVCGGDGLANLGARVVAGTGVPLGVIPGGTGNDVARYVGLDLHDPAAAAAVVAAGRTRSIDVARTLDRPFVTVLAAGFDARVNERANRMRWPHGQLRYHVATVAELGVFRPIRYVLELDGVELRTDAMLVAVGNGPSFGGGLRITEGARLDDGLLDVVIIEPISKSDLVRTYPKLSKGTHVHHPAYRHHRVREVTVAAPGVVAYADGERFGPLPLTVTVDPAALTVLVP